MVSLFLRKRWVDTWCWKRSLCKVLGTRIRNKDQNTEENCRENVICSSNSGPDKFLVSEIFTRYGTRLGIARGRHFLCLRLGKALDILPFFSPSHPQFILPHILINLS